ncbi:MAG TPA: hypothetical protein VMF06_15520, partial [Candidatus Limnocylindria bacterium]|nr:hypothetical protein [Candidatus Limnocylindria bacterium]
MNFRKLILAATLVTLAGTWAGRVIYRAHRNLVSLDVENVPLRKVVSQLKRQTWENIEVNKDVDGMVTLRCENTPLDLVLQRIGEQVSARTRVLFPLYANSASKKHFIQFVTGTAPQTTGWTNYETAESNIMLARMKERAEARQAAGTEAPAQEGPGAGGPGPTDGPAMGARGGLSSTTVMDLKLAVVPIATAAV